MNYKQFVFLFKKQLVSLSYSKQFDLALTVCKKLYPEYQKFCKANDWGNPGLLVQAIHLCAESKAGIADRSKIAEMLTKVDAIIPDMDDFGDDISAYALNASAAVYETLQFLIDDDKAHIYNVGICLTDTVDSKIQEERDLNESEIEQHPTMLEAWNYIIELSRE
jgi:uncharacterized protein YjaG (DUF416 family)